MVLCNFCNQKIKKSIRTFNLLNHLGGLTKFVECPQCKAFHLICDSCVSAATQYQAAYHEKLFTSITDIESEYLAILEDTRRIVIHDYKAFFGDKTKRLICEIGSGRGNLLKALIDEDYDVIGCETSSCLVDIGKKIYEIHENTFLNIDAWQLHKHLRKHSIKPNMLILWHSLEHIQYSLKLLKTLLSVCDQKITIVFQTPLPTPENIFNEHLFFPSSDTYHFLSSLLGLEMKLLYIIPYTRYMTCIMSSENLIKGHIICRSDQDNLDVVAQLIGQLNKGLIELDEVTKSQYRHITQLSRNQSPPTTI